MQLTWHAQTPALSELRLLDRDPTDDQIDQLAVRAYRLDRVREQMALCGINACLLFDPVNIRYATGSRNMQVFSQRNPARYLFLPLSGPVILFEFTGCEHLAAGLETIDEVRQAITASFVAAGPAIAERERLWARDTAAVIREHCGAAATVGIERVNAGASMALAAEGFRIVDAQYPVELARAVKSAEELKCVRASIRATERGVEALRAAIAPGLTEQQLWSILHQSVIAQGGDYVETRLLSAGERTNPWFQEASEKVIGPDELVALDTDVVGCFGYYCDFSRTFHSGPGKPDEAQRTLYRASLEQLHHNIGIIRPGMTFKEYSEHAWSIPERFVANRYYLSAHGVGMTGEYPYLYHRMDYPHAGYDGVIEPNMTLCVESYIGEEGGREGVKLEQHCLVTDSGIEVLSTFPFEDALMEDGAHHGPDLRLVPARDAATGEKEAARTIRHDSSAVPLVKCGVARERSQDETEPSLPAAAGQHGKPAPQDLDCRGPSGLAMTGAAPRPAVDRASPPSPRRAGNPYAAPVEHKADHDGPPQPAMTSRRQGPATGRRTPLPSSRGGAGRGDAPAGPEPGPDADKPQNGSSAGLPRRVLPSSRRTWDTRRPTATGREGEGALGPLSREALIQRIDLTLFAADMGDHAIAALCRQALSCGVTSISVPPAFIRDAATALGTREGLTHSSGRIGSAHPTPVRQSLEHRRPSAHSLTSLGPHAADKPASMTLRTTIELSGHRESLSARVRVLRRAIRDGARAIDIVMDTNTLRAGRHHDTLVNLRRLVHEARDARASVAVVLECGELTEAEQVAGARLAAAVRPDVIATGARPDAERTTVRRIVLIREAAGSRPLIRALLTPAGAAPESLIDAGAERLGVTGVFEAVSLIRSAS